MENREKFLEIRLLVAYLGEKDHFGWWDSQFLARSTGIFFLQQSFPRTPYLAAYTSIIQSAGAIHDRAIAKPGRLHLFRLPAQAEEQLNRNITNEYLKQFYLNLAGKENALDQLKTHFSQHIDSPQGAVQIGKLAGILTDQGLAEIAAHYFDAFSKEKQVFPYFA